MEFGNIKKTITKPIKTINEITPALMYRSIPNFVPLKFAANPTHKACLSFILDLDNHFNLRLYHTKP